MRFARLLANEPKPAIVALAMFTCAIATHGLGRAPPSRPAPAATARHREPEPQARPSHEHDDHSHRGSRVVLHHGATSLPRITPPGVS
jgi:hypothetical protein